MGRIDKRFLGVVITLGVGLAWQPAIPRSAYVQVLRSDWLLVALRQKANPDGFKPPQRVATQLNKKLRCSAHV